MKFFYHRSKTVPFFLILFTLLAVNLKAKATELNPPFESCSFLLHFDPLSDQISKDDTLKFIHFWAREYNSLMNNSNKKEIFNALLQNNIPQDKRQTIKNYLNTNQFLLFYWYLFKTLPHDNDGQHTFTSILKKLVSSQPGHQKILNAQKMQTNKTDLSAIANTLSPYLSAVRSHLETNASQWQVYHLQVLLKEMGYREKLKAYTLETLQQKLEAISSENLPRYLETLRSFIISKINKITKKDNTAEQNKTLQAFLLNDFINLKKETIDQEVFIIGTEKKLTSDNEPTQFISSSYNTSAAMLDFYLGLLPQPLAYETGYKKIYYYLPPGKALKYRYKKPESDSNNLDNSLHGQLNFLLPITNVATNSTLSQNTPGKISNSKTLAQIILIPKDYLTLIKTAQLYLEFLDNKRVTTGNISDHFSTKSEFATINAAAGIPERLETLISGAFGQSQFTLFSPGLSIKDKK